DFHVTGVQTCALPISRGRHPGCAQTEKPDDAVRPDLPPNRADGLSNGRLPAQTSYLAQRLRRGPAGLWRTPPIADRPRALLQTEIGRASCRERVVVSG